MPWPCSPRAGLTTTSPDLGEERQVVLVDPRCAVPPARHREPGAVEHPPGDALVVAAAHRHRGGQLGQRLAGDDACGRRATGASRPTPASITSTGMPRRIASSAMIRAYGLSSLEPSGGAASEQALVDRVLALDAEHRHALEPELLVEPDRGVVVVQHRQVDVGRPARGERSARSAASASPTPGGASAGPPPGTTGWSRSPGRRRTATWSTPVTVPTMSPVRDLLGDQVGEVPGALVAHRTSTGAGHHAVQRVDAVDARRQVVGAACGAHAGPADALARGGR